MSEIKTIFNQNKKKKQPIKDDSKIIITVKRELGGIIPKTIAKFTATQKKDRNFNLVLINDKHNFKEDVEIVKDRILDQLLYRLNIMEDKPKEERIKIIENNIKKQEDKLRDIKNGKYKEPEPIKASDINEETPDKKVKVRRINTVDEENKLLQYKKLLFVTQTEGDKVSYEGLTENGEREMAFTYKEGVFIPQFYNPTNCSMSPALGTKKKIYKSEQDLIDKDREDEKAGDFKGWFGIFTKAIVAIMIIGCMFWSNQIYINSQEVDAKIADYRAMGESAALKCAYFYSEAIESDIDIINYAEQILKSEAEERQESSEQVINRIRSLE